MPDLAAWLLEQIDTDERTVNQLFTGYAPGRTQTWSSPWTGGVDTGDELVTLNDGPLAYYVEAWDPARVLAECAAKRRIIAMHGPLEDRTWTSGADNGWLWCASCGNIDDRPEAYPCDTVRALAAVYADRPGYDPSWAPSGTMTP